MKSNNKSAFLIAIILTLVAVLSRIIPHYPNFTALGGIALFSSAYLGRKYLFLIVPILALFLSDLLLNNLYYSKLYPENYSGFTFIHSESLWVYGGIIVMAVAGVYIIKKVTITRFIGASFIGSILFFLITNFGSWITPTNPLPDNFLGLIATYELGLPFLLNSIGGNVFYGALLIGSYKLFSLGTHFVSSTPSEFATVRPNTKK